MCLAMSLNSLWGQFLSFWTEFLFSVGIIQYGQFLLCLELYLQVQEGIWSINAWISSQKSTATAKIGQSNQKREMVSYSVKCFVQYTFQWWLLCWRKKEQKVKKRCCAFNIQLSRALTRGHKHKDEKEKVSKEKATVIITWAFTSKVSQICQFWSCLQSVSWSSTKKLKRLQTRVKLLHERVHWRNRKIRNVKDLLNSLKEKTKLGNEKIDCLQENFGCIAKKLFQNQEFKATVEKAVAHWCNNETKQFAMTLHYDSPKAYEFVRKVLKLPHASSICMWALSLDCQPGYLTQVIALLGEMAQKNQWMRDAVLVCWCNVTEQNDCVWQNIKMLCWTGRLWNCHPWRESRNHTSLSLHTNSHKITLSCSSTKSGRGVDGTTTQMLMHSK